MHCSISEAVVEDFHASSTISHVALLVFPYAGCSWGVNYSNRSTKFWQKWVDWCATVQYKQSVWVEICTMLNGKQGKPLLLLMLVSLYFIGHLQIMKILVFRSETMPGSYWKSTLRNPSLMLGKDKSLQVYLCLCLISYIIPIISNCLLKNCSFL
jgi:hypothetical protein